MKIKYLIQKQSKIIRIINSKIYFFGGYSLGEKNRDLNRTFEKLEQLETAKQKLILELSAMKIALEEKDKEIQRYQKINQSTKKRGFCLV